MDITDSLKKACPICNQEDPPYEGHVRPSGDILYKYKCSRCEWPHFRVVRTPDYSVEPLVGFRQKGRPVHECARAHLLTSNGFKIIVHRTVSHNNQAFIKAQKAPEFDHQWRDIPSPAIELTQDRIIDFLKFTKLPPSFFKDKLCLDAGCGSGRFTWTMQQLGAKVSSFDISPEAIERCSKVNPSAYVQDIYDLEPHPIHDFVLCWGVLHHLPTPETGFQKISTQVAKGGVLHIMVYHKDTQKIYEKGRAQWPSLSHEERIKLCQNMIKRHGGNLHGWWDAFNPTYSFSHTPEEVCTWFEKQDFTEITVTQEKNINIRGIKK